jgi:hypothetical protein
LVEVAVGTGVFLALVLRKKALQLLYSLIHLLNDVLEMLSAFSLPVPLADGLVLEEGEVLRAFGRLSLLGMVGQQGQFGEMV